MEKPKRARRRKPDTAKADLKPPLVGSGWQGVHREVESEGHEEKYRAVIEGKPAMNRSAKGGDRSSLLHYGEGILIRPTSTKVCADGTVREEERVTSGELAESLAGTGVSEPISESEGASDALLVVGRLHSTRSAAKAARPRNRRLQWVGEGGWRRWLGRERNQMSKGGEVDQFHE